MVEYENTEVYHILRKKLLHKFAWKTFHMIDRVKINKLRLKYRNLFVVEEKYLVKTSKNGEFLEKCESNQQFGQF